MSLKSLLELAKQKSVMIATAESCTGGMVAANITDVAGSSAVLDRGFVTYSNQAKHDMLGVPLALIKTHGAVSEQVATAMAKGALHYAAAQLSVSITGIAGPGGGSDEKPVGLVFLATAMLTNRGDIKTRTIKRHFSGSRMQVRQSATQVAIDMLLYALQHNE